MLWAPAFTIPGEHGKTPYIPLGINSMASTDVYHTKRRRHNHPHPTLTVLRAPTIILYPMAWATRLSIRTLSLSCKAIPFIYKMGRAFSQKGEISSLRLIQHTTTEPPGLDLEHTCKHSAHSGVPVTLSPSNQSPTGPLVTPIFLLLVSNPTANFEHLGSRIKSPTDSNWT